ncbi:MAG: hypothetical protein F6J93_02900 [Oscillatoria sp. SIO1A7]|nr:hypothetical protein [Oscillatoria sp. SIO1A7]
MPDARQLRLFSNELLIAFAPAPKARLGLLIAENSGLETVLAKADLLSSKNKGCQQ